MKNCVSIIQFLSSGIKQLSLMPRPSKSGGNQPRTSLRQDHDRPRQSLKKVMILNQEEIQKLDLLKKMSVTPEKGGRKSVRTSVNLHKNNMAKKVELKDDTYRSEETKDLGRKQNNPRKAKAQHQKEEGFMQKCCTAFKSEPKEEENPFKKARKTHLKNDH